MIESGKPWGSTDSLPYRPMILTLSQKSGEKNQPLLKAVVRRAGSRKILPVNRD
jgi:hypothetical protein